MNNQPYDLKGHIKLATKTDADWLQLDMDNEPLILKKGEEINVIISDSPWTIWKKIGDGQTRYKELDFANGKGIKYNSIATNYAGQFNGINTLGWKNVNTVLMQQYDICSDIPGTLPLRIEVFNDDEYWSEVDFELSYEGPDPNDPNNTIPYTIPHRFTPENNTFIIEPPEDHISNNYFSVWGDFSSGIFVTISTQDIVPYEGLVYAIGAGTNDSDRRNAMEIYNDGRVELYRDAITEKEPVRYSQFIEAIGDVEDILRRINTGE